MAKEIAGRDCGSFRPLILDDLDNAATPGERARLLAHASECPACRGLMADLRLISGALAAIGRESSAPDASVLNTILRALRQAPAPLLRGPASNEDLCRELLDLPPADREAAAIRDRRYASASLVDFLIEKSYALRFADPPAGLSIARLAVVLAGSLRRRLPEQPYRDLRARALAFLANAKRLVGDYEGADEAFREALQDLRRGTGDESLGARVADFKATLLRSQQKFGEALSLVAEAERLFGHLGDSGMVCSAVLHRARILEDLGDTEAAMDAYRTALNLVDRERDPRMWLAAYHNFSIMLLEAGRIAEAEALVATLRPVYHDVGDPLDVIRLRWIEGLLARAREQWGAARQAFQEVLEVLEARGIFLDAALAALDILSVASLEGRADLAQQAMASLDLILSRVQVDGDTIEAICRLKARSELDAFLIGQIYQRLRRQAKVRAASAPESETLSG